MHAPRQARAGHSLAVVIAFATAVALAAKETADAAMAKPQANRMVAAHDPSLMPRRMSGFIENIRQITTKRATAVTKGQ
ncbi:hypothetical protein [Pseudoxanthomonas kalamensis]|uniref:hypothetical protein n=1 Tax=Pseudoxanthomonas kalamensis TaxID=289483 RepID=UPI00139204F2|nr:hypothetical protein [Pseudoxanthomonas kalamensis]